MPEPDKKFTLLKMALYTTIVFGAGVLVGLLF